VTVVGVPITDGPDNVTDAPGRTAFVLSFTVPLMAPVVELTVCAPADTTAIDMSTATTADRLTTVTTNLL
jgi:hypothetical protein